MKSQIHRKRIIKSCRALMSALVVIMFFNLLPLGLWKGQDAFVTKFDPSKAGADSLVYSTFLGGTSEERGFGIAVDAFGNAYIIGTKGQELSR